MPVNNLSVVYCRTYTSDGWNTWHKLMFEDNLPKSFDAVYILHQSGSYASGKATERLFVYLKVKTGYMKYALYHFVDTTINCDGWQIYHVYHVDDLNDTNQIDLTITGEWECAIHLKDRDDFMSSLSKVIGKDNIPETNMEIKESDYFDPNTNEKYM